MMAIKAKNPLSHHRSNSPMLSDKENNGSTTNNKHRFSPRIVSDNGAGSAAAKRNPGVSSKPRTRAATPPAKFSFSSERKPLKDLRTPTPQNRRNSAEKVAGSNPRCISNPIGSGSVRKTSSLDLIPKGFLARERSRTPDFKPNEKGKERASSAARVKNRTTTWSLDRTPRSSNELNGSTDSGPKSASCLTRKVSISGSGKIIIPAQNGLKKNCGLESGKTFSGSTGSGKGLAEHAKRHIQGRKNHGDIINKILDGVSKNQRGSRQQDGSRCQEVGGALTIAASPNARRAPRVAATPLQKVFLNNCDAIPSLRFIDKGCDSSTTPLSGLKGRYENSIPMKCRKDGVFTRQRGDFTPSPNIIGRRGAEFTPTSSNTNGKGEEFTPAPEANRKGGDFNPASNSNGNGLDFTPGPNTNGNGGDFTPAHYSVNATPEQRTQVTPPVQPSISPDIHSQTLDEIEDGHQHRCFGAGHVMAPAPGKVGDRRKCRPRGILIAGEATFIPLNENRRFSLVPVPAVASVKWMSPADAKNLTSPATTQGTPSSGFTQGTPSNALKNPSSQVTPPSGLNYDTPSSGYNSENPGLHDTSLSQIFESSPSPGPISTPSPQAGRPLVCINRAAPCSAVRATSSAFSSETQNLSTLTPAGFAHEVPFIRGISSSGLTTRTGYLESTPSSGVTSKFQNLIATPSSTSSKFQDHVFTSPSGSNPEIRNLHLTYPHEYKQDVPNLQVNPTHGFRSHVLSRYPSNLDVSPGYRFSPDISPHYGALQEKTPTRSSQLGFYPGPFFQDSKLHGSSSSLVNLVIPSQCAACSDGVNSSTPKVSSIAKDTSRHEMQVPFSTDINLARISWREGLVSRLFKLNDLDFCDLILDRDGKKDDENESVYRENQLSNTEDDVEYSFPFNSNLQPDAPFGSFEYMSETNAEKSDPLVSSLLEENILSQSLIGSHISSASPGLEATESIDAEDITTSSDRDWTFCYKNQLFEGAT